MLKKAIIIIGGGRTGTHIARLLSAALDPTKHDMVLVNPRSYRIVLPDALRLLVSDKESATDTIVPYDDLFVNNNGTFVQDAATSIRPGNNFPAGFLELRSREKMYYDILVLATGNVWDYWEHGGPAAFPDDAAEIPRFLAHSRERFAKAEHVALVGAGVAGITLASTIKETWPAKAVTIIHQERAVLNSTYSDEARSAAQSSLNGLGVQLLLGEVAQDAPTDSDVSPCEHISTTSGKTINADLVVTTHGRKPNTSVLSASPRLISNVVSETGLVKVNSFFQLPTHANIFAAGAVVDGPGRDRQNDETFRGESVAVLVAKNVVSLLKGTPLTKYKGLL